MREEFAEHEGVVGLGVVLREADVLVHVERHNILEPARPPRCQGRVRFGRRQQYTHESFPALTRPIRCLYVGIGDEPVGRPRTNGFSGVGLKSFILSPPISLASFHGGSTWLHMSTYRLAM